MSSKIEKFNIADDAARARKLLEKHAPVKISGLNKTNYTLQQGAAKNLGEHAVIVVLGENSSHQYTISRPIGVTDGDEEKDWVVNESEHIPSMMSRKLDPSLGSLNQERSRIRTELAVTNRLLVEKEEYGKTLHFYPNRGDLDRNTLLNEARLTLKQEQSVLKRNIEEATDRVKQNSFRNLLTQLTDPIKYLDTATALAESNLRAFWNLPEVLEYILLECPQTYRTLTGTYADQSQVIIKGAKGKSLDTVINGISARLAKISLEEAQGHIDPGTPAAGEVVVSTTNPKRTIEAPVSGTSKVDKEAKKENLSSSIATFVAKLKTPAKGQPKLKEKTPPDSGSAVEEEITPLKPSVGKDRPPKEVDFVPDDNKPF